MTVLLNNIPSTEKTGSIFYIIEKHTVSFKIIIIIAKIVSIDNITVLIDKTRRKRKYTSIGKPKSAKKDDLIPIGNFNVRVQNG